MNRSEIPGELQTCLLSVGPFEWDSVSVEVVDGERSFPPEIVLGADRHWSDLLRSKPHLFDGPVWTILEHQVVRTDESATASDGEPTPRCRLLLRLQRSTYRFAIYTHFADCWRQLSPSHRCNVFGVGALTFTSEGLVVAGLRSEKVAMLRGHWSYMPVGVADEPDVRRVLKKELVEELGLDFAEHVTDSWCLGLVDCGDEQGHVMNLVFVLQLGLNSDEVRCRYTSACDRGEHIELRFLKLQEIAGLEPLTEVTKRAVSSFPYVQRRRVLGADRSEAPLDRFCGGAFDCDDCGGK